MWCKHVFKKNLDMKKLLGIVVLGLGFMIIVNAPKQALAKDADGLIKELVNLARIPMMATTTRSSIRVKARWFIIYIKKIY